MMLIKPILTTIPKAVIDKTNKCSSIIATQVRNSPSRHRTNTS